MENPLLANSSALAIADNCIADCEVSSENLAVADCVLRIFENGIEKIQTALIIPSLLDEPETLKQYFSMSQLQKCINYYNQYLRHAASMQHTDQKHLHIALIELIDLFCENRNIRSLLAERMDNISNEHTELINALKKLKIVAEVRLKTTAVVEMRKEKAIHRIYQDNENTLKSLSRQKKQLHDQEINLRWKLAAKQSLIKKYEEDLAAKKWENNMKIKQEILKSARTIREIHTKSVLRQENLTMEVERAQTSYDKGLNSNLKTEKEIRDEKNKLLLQLQSLIKKYDQNIGDKIQENNNLQHVYDEQRRIMDIFLIEYNRQEDEYNELSEMKQNEETAEFERKLMLFMTTRAAKIVQRHYRKYLKIKKKTKTKSKGKKNKKK